MAQQFHAEGSFENDDYKVSWEKPLGFVVFPDGFQFTLFEYEAGLMDEPNIVSQLSKEILKHRDQYEPEYKKITVESAKYQMDPKTYLLEKKSVVKFLVERITHLLRGERIATLLSFEEFAMVKALLITNTAKDLMKEITIQMHFSNNDLDGFAFRIHKHKTKIQLEVIGFDFEYFKKFPAAEKNERLQRQKDYKQELIARSGVGFLLWASNAQVSKIQEAAYLAMMEAGKTHHLAAVAKEPMSRSESHEFRD